jgi:hypothetical protein
LEQDINLTFNISKKHKIAENYLLTSSMNTKTLIAEIYHPKEQHIDKEPPPRLTHERERAKEDKIEKIPEVLPN